MVVMLLLLSLSASSLHPSLGFGECALSELRKAQSVIVTDGQRNRESHTPRGGSAITYTLNNTGGDANKCANEYATIGGLPVQYDAAGNVTLDEDGRQYSYDEHNRLTQVRGAAAGNPTLAQFAYDALGRRVTAVFDPGAPNQRSLRYYYDGPRVVEERDAGASGEPRLRYHVHGGQFTDEHVATFTDCTAPCDGGPGFSYYLHNDLYSVAGLADASGGLVETYRYGAYGLSSVAPFACIPGDVDGDGVVDLADVPGLVAVLLTGAGTPEELCAADMNFDDLRDADDVPRFVRCLLTGACLGLPGRGPALSSPHTLHGRPTDVLSDGSMFQPAGPRVYDVRHGRWLQRDPKGYIDGGNLYESFGGNPTANSDSSGLSISITADGFGNLVYQYENSGWFTRSTVIFTHPFARALPDKLRNLVVLDHPDWPYAFVMLKQDAIDEFKRKEYTHPYQFMQHACYLAKFQAHLIVVVIDKHPGRAGWFDPHDVIGDFASDGADRAMELGALAQRGLQVEVARAQNFVAISFQVTTGLLTFPAGIGGVVVDLGDAASRVVRGHADIGEGVVITALVAGVALHLRVSGEGGLFGRGVRAAEGAAAESEAGAVRVIEQGRDILGRFAPKLGGEVRPGLLAEEAAERAIAGKPGYTVVAKHVYVRNPVTSDIRVLDRVVRSPSGELVGVEVKSGSGTRNAAQRAFDQALSATHGGYPTFGTHAERTEIEGEYIRKVIVVQVP